MVRGSAGAFLLVGMACASPRSGAAASGTPPSLAGVQTNPHNPPPADGTVHVSLMHHTVTSACKPWSAAAPTARREKVGGSNHGPRISNKKIYCKRDGDFDEGDDHDDLFSLGDVDAHDDDARC